NCAGRPRFDNFARRFAVRNFSALPWLARRLSGLAEALWPREARGRKNPSPPPSFWRVWVLAPRAHRQADRHADEAEGFAQAVDEVALVALGNLVDRIAEQHEERRTRLGLGHVADLDPPARYSR